MSANGQKFVGRNRAPRVQIEYDVESYGATEKKELPMVVGVMADLYGQQATPAPKVEDRRFVEIDHDNFDNRLRAMKPRVAANIPNKITGDGTLGIDLTFRSMDDFSPTAIANNVEPLRRLLEARKKLSDLIAFMDGRGDAEALISESLKNPQKLLELMNAGSPSQPTAQAEPSTDNRDDQEV